MSLGERGVFYWDKELGEFKKGRPPAVQKFGQAPMVMGDEIPGGRYSPADGRVYDSKKDWHQSLKDNDIEFVPVGTKPPPVKYLRQTEEEYAVEVRAEYQEAQRQVKWKEALFDEAETEEAKKYKEGVVNKYGTEKQRKRKRKVVEEL